jgi:hypothetical protein
MANTPFSNVLSVPCHGTTNLNVVYTNMSTSIDAWIDKVEASLAAVEVKIVGVDVEYT